RLMEGVVDKRRKEFTAGRLCAREALSLLGIREFPLLIGENRVPLWPDHLTGCISHTADCCGVVVAPANQVSAMGLDIESTERVKEKLWSMIFSPSEIAWLQSLPLNERPRYASLIFSAKECFYKCQYMLTRQWLGFMDASIHSNLESRTFEVTLLSHINESFPAGSRMSGGYVFHKDLVYTGMCFIYNS
ncbi:MAG: 4'-phosphopantetheinyl transferase superfamily protein, partial [Planctomycetota bacterium]